MRDHILFFLNGRERRVDSAHAFLNLSTWLRQVEFAAGTKVVCEEGDCGACTVLVGRMTNGELRYSAVNSCIQLVAQLDATHVVTVEGVSASGVLSLIQEKMVELQGAQCGYCTPGFIVAMTALAEQKERWGASDVRDALTGNLCRCTGYEPIIKAGLAASGNGGRLSELYPPAPIAEVLSRAEREGTAVEWGPRRFFAPALLAEALQIKQQYPDAIVVQGGTDAGVYANKRGVHPRIVLNLSHIPELSGIRVNGETLRIGATTTLTELERATEALIPQLHQILKIFGAPQIRNAGTVAGNIANGSPIADLLPFLFVAGAEVELTSLRGWRSVNINSLYTGYKRLDLAADELITAVLVPVPTSNQTLRLYKVSKRHDLDISAFTAAFLMSIADGRMSEVRIAFGGVAPTVSRMPQLESLLEGKELREELFQRAGEEAARIIEPISDVRGSAVFRRQLAENVMMKFYFDVTAQEEAMPLEGAI